MRRRRVVQSDSESSSSDNERQEPEKAQMKAKGSSKGKDAELKTTAADTEHKRETEAETDDQDDSDADDDAEHMERAEHVTRLVTRCLEAEASRALTYGSDGRRSAARLRILKSTVVGSERVIDIKFGFTLVGRGGHAIDKNIGLCLAYDGVSSLHALIEADHISGLHFVEDLYSTNETIIGEMPLAPRRAYQLSHGCSLTFGTVKCIYEFVPPPAPKLTATASFVSARKQVKDASTNTEPHPATCNVAINTDPIDIVLPVAKVVLDRNQNNAFDTAGILPPMHMHDSNAYAPTIQMNFDMDFNQMEDETDPSASDIAAAGNRAEPELESTLQFGGAVEPTMQFDHMQHATVAALEPTLQIHDQPAIEPTLQMEPTPTRATSTATRGVPSISPTMQFDQTQPMTSSATKPPPLASSPAVLTTSTTKHPSTNVPSSASKTPTASTRRGRTASGIAMPAPSSGLAPTQFVFTPSMEPTQVFQTLPSTSPYVPVHASSGPTLLTSATMATLAAPATLPVTMLMTDSIGEGSETSNNVDPPKAKPLVWGEAAAGEVETQFIGDFAEFEDEDEDGKENAPSQVNLMEFALDSGPTFDLAGAGASPVAQSSPPPNEESKDTEADHDSDATEPGADSVPARSKRVLDSTLAEEEFLAARAMEAAEGLAESSAEDLGDESVIEATAPEFVADDYEGGDLDMPSAVSWSGDGKARSRSTSPDLFNSRKKILDTQESVAPEPSPLAEVTNSNESHGAPSVDTATKPSRGGRKTKSRSTTPPLPENSIGSSNGAESLYSNTGRLMRRAAGSAQSKISAIRQAELVPLAEAPVATVDTMAAATDSFSRKDLATPAPKSKKDTSAFDQSTQPSKMNLAFATPAAATAKRNDHTTPAVQKTTPLPLDADETVEATPEADLRTYSSSNAPSGKLLGMPGSIAKLSKPGSTLFRTTSGASASSTLTDGDSGRANPLNVLGSAAKLKKAASTLLRMESAEATSSTSETLFDTETDRVNSGSTATPVPSSRPTRTYGKPGRSSASKALNETSRAISKQTEESSTGTAASEESLVVDQAAVDAPVSTKDKTVTPKIVSVGSIDDEEKQVVCADALVSIKKNGSAATASKRKKRGKQVAVEVDDVVSAEVEEGGCGAATSNAQGNTMEHDPPLAIEEGQLAVVAKGKGGRGRKSSAPRKSVTAAKKDIQVTDTGNMRSGDGLEDSIALPDKLGNAQEPTSEKKNKRKESPDVTVIVEIPPAPLENLGFAHLDLSNAEGSGSSGSVESLTEPSTSKRRKTIKPKIEPPSSTRKKATSVESVAVEDDDVDTQSVSLKRSASLLKEANPPKRGRKKSMIAGGDPALSQESLGASVASAKLESGYVISFTGLVSTDPFKEVVDWLGATCTEDWKACTHLVTDKVRRTTKFLCALSAGKYIVSTKWIDQSKKDGRFVAESKYIIKDKANEKQYGFSVEESIKTAQNKNIPPFLTGVTIYTTPRVRPGRSDMKEIIAAAGGSFTETMPASAPSDDNSFVVVGCPEDAEECAKLSKRGFQIQSNEFVVTGSLRQKLDYDSHRLNPNAASASTPGSIRKKKK
ncbi:Mediator of DNA damage checkpoint protein 1 [Chytriomyces hyalinus]|nr:Mediator of DNA damage checkpoint protein 1 [Chytriomyces hyalinus]